MIDISVLCLTYARTQDLNELVFSFLNQNFTGNKELIILNDRDDQNIIFDHPQVRIINVKERFKTLGDKRNYILDKAKYDYISFWDNDDIYLPDFLDKLSNFIGNKPVTREYKMWANYFNEKELKLEFNKGMNNYLIKKSLISQLGYFDSINTSEDIRIIKKMVKAGHLKNNVAFLIGIPSFILRRREDMEGYNITSANLVDDFTTKSLDYVKYFVDLAVSKGVEPTGDIQVKPAWKIDYSAWVKESWDNWIKSSIVK